MAFAYTTTDELSAVNTLLSTIGEPPVNSLEVSGSVFAEIAKAILHEVNRKVQTKGWHFNKEPDFAIAPTVDGDLVIAENVLQIDTTDAYASHDLVQRGGRMYDRQHHTYSFTDTLKFNITFFLPFTEIPEAARQYIMVKAARIFQDRMITSDILHAFTVQDENEAMLLLLESDSDTADYNIFTGDPALAKIVNR